MASFAGAAAADKDGIVRATSEGEVGMKAMVLRGATLSVEEVEKPRPGPGQVVGRVLACGICGSDLHQARFLDDMLAAMAESGNTAFDGIDPGRCVVMGHEFVARIEELGPGVEAWQPGDRVITLPVLPAPHMPAGFVSIGYSSDNPGAYGEYVVMAERFLLRVPDSLPDLVAAATEPCAVGLHAVRRAEMRPGEHALVMGAGPIGLMTLLWLKHEGVPHVTVTEIAEERRALAARMGADLVVDPREADPVAAVKEVVGSQPPVVFEAIGVPGTLGEAMRLVARGGRVIVEGVCMQPDTIRPMVGTNKHLRVDFVLGYSAEEYAETLDALAGASSTPRR
ncbi:MAG: zinc-binding dehydrogenase [Dehalococcoidia bacterium]